MEFPLQNALRKGLANLQKHIDNGVKYGVPVIVAINAMKADTENEWKMIKDSSLQAGAMDTVVSTHWEDGGLGAIKLAETVVRASQQPQQFKCVIHKNNYILKISKILKYFISLGFCTI